MDPAEFDLFAEEYASLHRANISASGESPEYFAEYKVKDLRTVAAEAGADLAGRFLDFGAGVGTSVPFFRKHLPSASVTCVDVSMKSLDLGAARFSDCADFVAFDGAVLPFADGSFDYAFAACVFHHIPSAEHGQLLQEIARVLKPGGGVVLYEHNPLNPLTVRAVNTCPFDENAVLLRSGDFRARVESAGFREARVRYRVFFPRALRWLRSLEARLAWLPLGAQYYVCARK